MVQLKSQRELGLMRQSGQFVAKILSTLASEVGPGTNLLDIDKRAAGLGEELGIKCAFKGYMGFPSSICLSVNDQIVHGIARDRCLEEGDILGMDFGVIYEGYYGDSAVTVPIGNIPEKTQKLMRTTMDSLYAGIAAARAGNTVKDIATAVENVIRPKGYGIVKEFVGHGIGQKLHEDPQVPNYAAGASNLPLRAGMTIAIEPMVNAGGAEVRVLSDKWTAVTADGSLSAHYEHTIAITDDEPEILTEWGEAAFGGLADALGGH